MNVLDFKLPIKNQELSFKRIYHVETTRFPHEKYPKSAADICVKTGRLFVVVGAGTELHTVQFKLLKNKAIDVKRYHFDASIIDVSACVSKEYFYFVATTSNNNCFIVQPNGKINLIQQKNVTKSIIFENKTKNNQMYLTLGTSTGKVILIYPILGEELYATVTKKAPVTSLRSSLDGSKIITGFSNGNVTIFDADTLEELWSRTFPFGSIIDAVTCPNDQYLSLAAQDDNVYVCSTKSDETLTIPGHTSFVISIDPEKYVKNDEYMFTSSGLDGRFGCWKVKLGSENLSYEKIFLSSIFSIPIRFTRFYKRVLLTVNDKAEISVYIAN